MNFEFGHDKIDSFQVADDFARIGDEKYDGSGGERPLSAMLPMIEPRHG